MADDAESVRPPGIPDDYSQIKIRPKDGPPLLVWGRVIETKTPDRSNQTHYRRLHP